MNIGRNKIYKVKGKKRFNYFDLKDLKDFAAKAKNVELTEAFIEVFSGVFIIQSNI